MFPLLSTQITERSICPLTSLQRSFWSDKQTQDYESYRSQARTHRQTRTCEESKKCQVCETLLLATLMGSRVGLIFWGSLVRDEFQPDGIFKKTIHGDVYDYSRTNWRYFDLRKKLSSVLIYSQQWHIFIKVFAENPWWWHTRVASLCYSQLASPVFTFHNNVHWNLGKCCIFVKGQCLIYDLCFVKCYILRF